MAGEEAGGDGGAGDLDDGAGVGLAPLGGEGELAHVGAARRVAALARRVSPPRTRRSRTE